MSYICTRKREIVRRLGEMAEWSNAAVLKTVDCNRSGGSNPSFSAKGNPQQTLWVFYFTKNQTCLPFLENKKDKILGKNMGFYACSGYLTGMHVVNPDLFQLIDFSI